MGRIPEPGLATLSEWDAEVVFRGKHAEALTTEQGYTHAIITRFSDDAAIRSWYEAPTYQALIPPREQAVEMVLIGYDRSPAFPSISSCRLTSGPCRASSLRGAYAGMGPTIRL